MRSAPKSARPPDGRGRNAIRVLIADDHRTFAEALKVAIRTEDGLSVVAVVYDGESAVEAAREKHPDVVLMDVQMPGTDGITATKRIKEEEPDTRVVMLSAQEGDHLMARAIDAGAAGFLTKDQSVRDVTRSIRAAYRGDALIEPEEVRRILRQLRRRREQDAAAKARVDRLTAREAQILQQMADGLPSERIAEELGISPHTLRTHVQNILFKLKVHSKLEALAQAIRYGRVHTGETL